MAKARLARAEMEVAQIVWKLREARVREVFDAMPADKRPDFWTVQTYLRRLKAKGYLRTRRDGRADVYSPSIKPTQVIRNSVKDFVDRLFDGNALPLVQQLIDDRGLSDDDIDQLQATLDQLKRQRAKR